MKLLNVLALTTSLSVFHAYADNSYQWLRDDSRSEPRVQQYLRDQNAKADRWFEPHNSEIQALVGEWQQTAQHKAPSPALIRSHQQYNDIHWNGDRQLVKLNAQHEVKPLLNLSVRADAFDYYQLAAWMPDTSGEWIALAEDTRGDEQFRITLVHVTDRTERVISTTASTYFAWAPDGKSLYYLSNLNSTTQLQRFELASGESTQLGEWRSAEWLFSLYSASNSRYIVIQQNNENATQQRLLDTQTGRLMPWLRSAEEGVEYYVDVLGDTLYINSNHQGTFQLYRQPLPQVELNWQPFITHKEIGSLSNFYLFDAGIVLVEDQSLAPKIWVLDYQGEVRTHFELQALGQVAWISRNGDAPSNRLRVRAMSMTEPASWHELDVAQLQWQTLSQDSYAGFDSAQYQTHTVWVAQGDIKVPVTLAYRRDKLTPSSSVVLYGYGAYGVTMKPYFMPQIVSLLDRGMIYAIAHVRGGGYLGEAWHQAGAGLNKQNGIDDFLAAARFLTNFDQGTRVIYAIGGSAGGTLVAAALNRQPDVFAGAVLQVPFVDVLASMSDTSQTLTAQQYQEWGNPTLPEQRQVMAAYDPVSNLRAVAYPPTLVNVGWWDNRVPYWEGARYLARLSDLSQGAGPYLLSTDFQAGHASDRRQALEKQAREYAFFLTLDKNRKAGQ